MLYMYSTIQQCNNNIPMHMLMHTRMHDSHMHTLCTYMLMHMRTHAAHHVSLRVKRQ